jgi:hypothetical protein
MGFTFSLKELIGRKEYKQKIKHLDDYYQRMWISLKKKLVKKIMD